MTREETLQLISDVRAYAFALPGREQPAMGHTMFQIALELEKKMAVWVSIEHAKKDGTRYDLWVREPNGSGRRVADAKWAIPPGLQIGTWCEWIEDDWNMWVGIVGRGGKSEVTHFMEIPEGPKESK